MPDSFSLSVLMLEILLRGLLFYTKNQFVCKGLQPSQAYGHAGKQSPLIGLIKVRLVWLRLIKGKVKLALKC